MLVLVIFTLLKVRTCPTASSSSAAAPTSDFGPHATAASAAASAVVVFLHVRPLRAADGPLRRRRRSLHRGRRHSFCTAPSSTESDHPRVPRPTHAHAPRYLNWSKNWSGIKTSYVMHLCCTERCRDWQGCEKLSLLLSNYATINREATLFLDQPTLFSL